MDEKYLITNSELEVMKVLWELGSANLPQIIDKFKQNSDWSSSTIKTLINRLVKKGSIDVDNSKKRNYIYTPAIEKDEYVEYENKTFLQKLYDGSISNMLLNMVNKNQISKEDLEELIDKIERDD